MKNPVYPQTHTFSNKIHVFPNRTPKRVQHEQLQQHQNFHHNQSLHHDPSLDNNISNTIIRHKSTSLSNVYPEQSNKRRKVNRTQQNDQFSYVSSSSSKEEQQ